MAHSVTCRICCFTQASSGLVVALISTMRLDATGITTKMYTVVKSAVYWVRNSTAKTRLAWFRMKVIQVWPPLGSRDLTMYLRTVLVEWVTPSFKPSYPGPECSRFLVCMRFSRITVAGYVRVSNILNAQYLTPSTYPAKVAGVIPDDIHNRGIEIQVGPTYSFR